MIKGERPHGRIVIVFLPEFGWQNEKTMQMQGGARTAKSRHDSLPLKGWAFYIQHSVSLAKR